MLFTRHCSSREEKGQGLVEYSFILLLVAIVVVFVVSLFGVTLKNQYCRIVYGLSPLGNISTACTVPFASPSMIEQGPGYLNLEAEVFDPDGDPDDPYAAISKVEFYIDDSNGSPVRTEHHYQYCLGGNQSGQPCNNHSIGGLSPGEHTVIIKVYDTDGNIGTARHNFSV